jgi:uncharacterized protein HemY
LNQRQDSALQDENRLSDAGTESQETEAVVIEKTDSAEGPLATLELEVTASGDLRPRSRHERVLRSLNRAIAEHPTSPTNYVLRGELALETKDYGQAAADFETALELAAVQVETETWGIVAQMMQDRAYAGLARATEQASKRK